MHIAELLDRRHQATATTGLQMGSGCHIRQLVGRCDSSVAEERCERYMGTGFPLRSRLKKTPLWRCWVWPLFHEDGELLHRDSRRWKARHSKWRSERAQASLLRVGSSDRPHSYAVHRSAHATFNDVRLLSPPAASVAGLLKLKRKLSRTQHPALARRRQRCTTVIQPTTRAFSKHPVSPQHTPDIEIHAPEDLF